MIIQSNNNKNFQIKYAIYFSSYSFNFIRNAFSFVIYHFKKYYKTQLLLKDNVILKMLSCTMLPKKKKRFTFLRSPHGHKKSRDQMEICRFKGIITFQLKIIIKEQNTIALFLKSNYYLHLLIYLLFLNKIPNVFIKIKKKIITKK